MRMGIFKTQQTESLDKNVMLYIAPITRRSSLLRAYGPARDLGFASAPYLKRYVLE